MSQQPWNPQQQPSGWQQPTPPPLPGQPGYGQPGPGQPAYGQPYGQPMMPAPRPMSPEDCSQASMAHWLGILLGWIGPLIVLLTSGERSPYVKAHAYASLNFHITLMIGYAVAWVGSFFLIGVLLIPALLIVQIVLPIMACGPAGRGELYEYPATLKLLK